MSGCPPAIPMVNTMKLRELLYLLGFRRPRTQVYGHEIVTVDLPRDGQVRLARWLHPVCLDDRWTVHQDRVDALRTFLRPGDVVLDIGAWQGDTALPYGLAVGTSGAVLAFEPNRYIFPVLAANAELNRDKVRIIPCMYAAAPKAGTLTFEYGDPSFNNGGRHEGISKWRHGSVFELQVEAVRVEDFLQANHPVWAPETPAGEFRKLLPVELKPPRSDRQGRDAWS